MSTGEGDMPQRLGAAVAAAMRTLRSWPRDVKYVIALTSVCSLFVVVAYAARSSFAGTAPPSKPHSLSVPPVTLGAPAATPPMPLDPALFPEVDTPFAQASPQLQAAWAAYDVTIIPSRHVLDSVPQAPRIRNLTNGAVSDAEAQSLLRADLRANGYIGWMEAHDQVGFNHHLRGDSFIAGSASDAMKAHQPIEDPACDLYPSKAALVPVDEALRSFLAGRGFTTARSYALALTYAGPCTVTAMTPGGARVLSAIPPQGGTGIEVGSVVRDPVLGDIWVAEAGRSCPGGSTLPFCDTAQ
jgi:hypothetical protein